jgi:Flp pilus assembly pilin Flp
MKSLLLRLWKDDHGAIITAEFVLILSVLVFGLIPGLVALRNSGISTMATIGNLLQTIVPSFTFSGFTLGVNGATIGQVSGFSFTPGTIGTITSGQISPVNLTNSIPPLQVDPVP